MGGIQASAFLQTLLEKADWILKFYHTKSDAKPEEYFSPGLWGRRFFGGGSVEVQGKFHQVDIAKFSNHNFTLKAKYTILTPSWISGPTRDGGSHVATFVRSKIRVGHCLSGSTQYKWARICFCRRCCHPASNSALQICYSFWPHSHGDRCDCPAQHLHPFSPQSEELSNHDLTCLQTVTDYCALELVSAMRTLCSVHEDEATTCQDWQTSKLFTGVHDSQRVLSDGPIFLT